MKENSVSSLMADLGNNISSSWLLPSTSSVFELFPTSIPNLTSMISSIDSSLSVFKIDPALEAIIGHTSVMSELFETMDASRLEFFSSMGSISVPRLSSLFSNAGSLPLDFGNSTIEAIVKQNHATTDLLNSIMAFTQTEVMQSSQLFGIDIPSLIKQLTPQNFLSIKDTIDVGGQFDLANLSFGTETLWESFSKLNEIDFSYFSSDISNPILPFDNIEINLKSSVQRMYKLKVHIAIIFAVLWLLTALMDLLQKRDPEKAKEFTDAFEKLLVLYLFLRQESLEKSQKD